VTDFTYIAGFIYFVHIEFNSVVVVVVVVVVEVEVVVVKLVVVAVVVVRNVCYNGYLPQLMLCSSGTWIVRRKVGENVGYAQVQNCFVLDSWYYKDMFPGSAKNILLCIVPQ